MEEWWDERHVAAKDPATRPTGSVDCNQSAMAGFAASALLGRTLTNSLIQYLAELDCFNRAIKTLACFLIAVLAIKLQRQLTPPRRLQAERANTGMERSPLQLSQQERAVASTLKVARNPHTPQFSQVIRAANVSGRSMTANYFVINFSAR